MTAESLLEMYDEYEQALEGLKTKIEGSFFASDIFPKIHYFKTRKKIRTHLKNKIERKQQEGRLLTENNFFDEITDLIGCRILLLFPQHFKYIHEFILSNDEWELKEDPIAYTWDPETKKFFSEELLITDVKEKPSYYTSIHYVVNTYKTPNTPCCEIQVRTLLEEVWGEIDHEFNYPDKNENKHLQDSLKALAKLIASGAKLTEIIYNLGEENSSPALPNQES